MDMIVNYGAWVKTEWFFLNVTFPIWLSLELSVAWKMGCISHWSLVLTNNLVSFNSWNILLLPQWPPATSPAKTVNCPLCAPTAHRDFLGLLHSTQSLRNSWGLLSQDQQFTSERKNACQLTSSTFLSLFFSPYSTESARIHISLSYVWVQILN
jgi:hypothetical protein